MSPSYINKEQLDALILSGESERIDFKQEWHKNKVYLVHDILCLANAILYTESDRFLIFGVTDDGKICGIDNDPNKKNNAELHDLINKISFNRRPEIKVSTIIVDGNEVDYIHIRDKPEKPYYLIKDYQPKENNTNPNDMIRAGVIYTRTGDRNTSITGEGVHDIHLQAMIEERIGINKSIKERFRIYLNNLKNWTSFNGEDDNDGYYYNTFPEFTLIRKSSTKEYISRNESWMPSSINAQAFKVTYVLKYHTTLIMEVAVFNSGDGNYELCYPKIDFVNSNRNNPDEKDNIYYFTKDSIRYNISCLLHHNQARKFYDFRTLKIEIRQ